MSVCAECAGEMLCSCFSCAEENAGKIVWGWKGDIMVCGHCGFEAHCDWWLDWDGIQLEMEYGPTQMLQYLGAP